MPLYDVENPYNKATEGYAQASGTLRGITSGSKSVTTGPGPSIGGGIQSGMGGAAAGAMVGAEIGSVGGPWGAAIGFGLGAMSYFLS